MESLSKGPIGVLEFRLKMILNNLVVLVSKWIETNLSVFCFWSGVGNDQKNGIG